MSACIDSAYCSSGKYCDLDISSSTLATCISQKSDGAVCTADDQCKIGSACNLLICTQLWSLDNGVSAEDSRFCMSNHVNSALKCDSSSVYVAGVKLASPFVCTIGTTCTYKYDIAGTTTGSMSCQCAGNGSTSGYCPPAGLSITGLDDVIFPKLQYRSSDCAGDVVHSDDLVTLNYCNSLSDSALEYATKMGDIMQFWSLYNSGAINSCSSDLGAFDSSYDINSYSGAEILAVSALVALFY